MIAELGRNPAFPPLEHALEAPNGLLAVGGDLEPATLVRAYRHGAFPWFSDGQPILWWSPDPRMVLYVQDFHASRSLRRRVRENSFEIRTDCAFAAVIAHCATVPRAGQDGTWITSAMRAAYIELHRRAYAHSVEAWQDGLLVGGLYGLRIGNVFFGESMFALRADASKVALCALVSMLRELHVELIDCQQETAHLASFGARTIPRALFAAELRRLIHSDEAGPWPLGSVRVGV
jgi:leucyl/phenylalanyl-tRNA--protein transferase